MATKRKRPAASQLEKTGVRKFGGIGLETAQEKALYMKRTGKDPVQGADLDAEPDDWNTGGLREPTGRIR